MEKDQQTEDDLGSILRDLKGELLDDPLFRALLVVKEPNKLFSKKAKKYLKKILHMMDREIFSDDIFADMRREGLMRPPIQEEGD